MVEITGSVSSEPLRASDVLAERTIKAANTLEDPELKEYLAEKTHRHIIALQVEETARSEAKRGIHNAIPDGRHKAREFSDFLEDAKPADLKIRLAELLDKDIQDATKRIQRDHASLEERQIDDEDYFMYDHLVSKGQAALENTSDRKTREFIEESINQFARLRKRTQRFEILSGLKKSQQDLARYLELKEAPELKDTITLIDAIPDKDFSIGNKVKIRRSNGAIEDDWAIVAFDLKSARAVVVKFQDNVRMQKEISAADLVALNAADQKLIKDGKIQITSSLFIIGNTVRNNRLGGEYKIVGFNTDKGVAQVEKVGEPSYGVHTVPYTELVRDNALAINE